MENELIKSPLEKASDMSARYSNGNEDPWGNRKSKLYQRVFKKATELAYGTVELPEADSDGKHRVNLYDVGCGGGNIIDTWVENKPEYINLNITGCDLSNDAISYLLKRYPEGRFDCVDLEEYDSRYPLHNLANADIVSIVDVMYYFDAKRHYSLTVDEIWNTIKPGTIVVVADNLVRSFRRDYLGKKKDCITLASYTEDSEPVSTEQSLNERTGKVRTWHRYLKVRIFMKTSEEEGGYDE